MLWTAQYAKTSAVWSHSARSLVWYTPGYIQASLFYDFLEKFRSRTEEFQTNPSADIHSVQSSDIIPEPIITKMLNHSKVRLTTLIYIYYDYFYPGAMLCWYPQHGWDPFFIRFLGQNVYLHQTEPKFSVIDSNSTSSCDNLSYIRPLSIEASQYTLLG